MYLEKPNLNIIFLIGPVKTCSYVVLLLFQFVIA
jgi:hypothetical protein